MNECNHIKDDGTTAIVFGKNKWIGVYPRKMQGFCTKCKDTVFISEYEYKKMIKQGGDKR